MKIDRLTDKHEQANLKLTRYNWTGLYVYWCDIAVSSQVIKLLLTAAFANEIG